MKKNNTILSKITSLIFFIIVIFILTKLYGIYKDHYFNDFMKAEYNLRKSSFTRDNEVTTSNGDRSYKIESEIFNDAIFYKTIKVEPNTPYKVKCMVKTENVEPEDEKTDAGASICILGTVENSRSIIRYE